MSLNHSSVLYKKYDKKLIYTQMEVYASKILLFRYFKLFEIH